MTGRHDVGWLDPREADDERLVQHLARQVNDVYAVAERGFWVPGAMRTWPEAMAGFIRNREIVAARDGGRIVGSTRVRQVGEGVTEFGMLFTATDRRGEGIGRALIDFAEQDARRRGHHALQLELLVPREGRHPGKEELKDWYERLGFRATGTRSFDEAYPHAAPFLATPCDLQVYRKRTGPPQGG